jgi:hypothetical protein
MAYDTDRREPVPPAPGYEHMSRRRVRNGADEFAPLNVRTQPDDNPDISEDQERSGAVMMRALAEKLSERPTKHVAEIVRRFTHTDLMEMAGEIAAALDDVGFKPAGDHASTANFKNWIVAGVLDDWAKKKAP